MILSLYLIHASIYKFYIFWEKILDWNKIKWLTVQFGLQTSHQYVNVTLLELISKQIWLTLRGTVLKCNQIYLFTV
jgi:hypothetical protein